MRSPSTTTVPDRPGAPVPILLQVNVDDDPAKAGFDPAAALAVAA